MVCMKKVTLLVMLIPISLISNGQRDDRYYYWPIDTVTQKIAFTEVVYILNTPAEKVFNSARNYIANTFNKEKEEILSINDTTYTVVAKGAFMTAVPQLADRGKGYITFRLTLICRDHNYRYTLTDLQHYPLREDGVVGGPLENEKTISGGMLFPRKYWEWQKEQCYYYVQNIIEQMKEAMLKHAKG